MTLINRVARLFRADIHGILDCIEEPAVILKQAVREMEQEIQKRAAQLKQLEAHTQDLSGQLGKRRKGLSEIGEQIELCFRAGNEELGRNFVRKRLESERSIQAIEEQIEACDNQRRASEKRLTEQREKLQSVIEKMDLLGEQTRSAEGAAQGMFSESPRISDEEVEIAFLKEKEKRAKGGRSTETSA